MLADFLPVIDGERQNIVQINLVVHVVDIKPQIIRVQLNRVEVARVNRLYVDIGLELLCRARQVLQHGITLFVLSPLLELVKDRIVNRRPDVRPKDCVRRLVRYRHLVPFRERSPYPRSIRR